MMTLDDVRGLGDTPVVALTLYGEARGEPVEGRIGVGCAIRNRVRAPGWWGHGYTDVCLAQEQFSCWNVSDPNRPKLLALAQCFWASTPIEDSILSECQWIADGLIGGRLTDRIGRSATHYYATSLTKPPAWTVGAQLVARIGGHLFYAGVH